MIEWILSSSVLIVMVITIRCFFRYKLSMRMRYALWLAVALRLLIPVSFWESSFSVLNLLKVEGMAAGQDVITKQPDVGRSGGASASADVQPGVLEGLANTGDGIGNKMSGGREAGNGPEAPNGKESGNGLEAPGDKESGEGLDVSGLEASGSPGTSNGRESGNGLEASNSGEGRSSLEDTDFKNSETGGLAASIISALRLDGPDGYFPLFFCIWISGMVLCAGITLIMNISYRNRVYRSRKRYTDTVESRIPVYSSPVINTPCMFGLLHPAVYLTPKAAEAENSLKYILCHENTHYRHKDNLWALVRVVCTCIHWYNPLAWLAAYLSRQDCELACDEVALELLGENERIPYGRALLEFSVQNSMLVGDFRLSTTISGGKKQLKERLLVIAKRPEKYAGAVVMVILFGMLVLLATFTGRKDTLNNDFFRGDSAIGFGLDFTLKDSFGSPDGTLGSGITGNGINGSGNGTAGNGMGDSGSGNTGIGPDVPGSNPLEGNQQGTEYYTGQIPVNLNDGEEYILRIGGETVAGSGEYQIDLLELCKIYDKEEKKEEVLQSISMKDLKVLYTRPSGASGPYLDSITSIWQFSTGREPLYAKPLCTTSDLPERAVGQFLEGGSRPVLAGSRDGGILMTDLDFDGYEDFCLPAGIGSANVPYYCFLYKPEEKQFQYSYMIPNVRADEATHLIESRTSDGDGVYSIKYYRFDEENRLHLVRYVEENQSADATFPVLDLTYCETSYALPAVDEWDYGTVYGGALAERMVYWAKQALAELYEWSGTKIDTTCFAVTEFGDVLFGNSFEDLKASRSFYERRYGAEGGFIDCITCMELVTERVVWYSPVTQWNVPGNLGDMTDMQVVEWYFAQSPPAKGEALDTIEENFEGNYVICTKSGNYYELTLNKATREVDSVYGPYESYPVH